MRVPRRLLNGLVVASLLSIVACGREKVAIDSPPPDPVEVEASVDRAVATTGDLLTYRVRVERAPEFEVDIAEAGAEISGFRITDTRRESSTLRSGRIADERIYELRADLVGSYILPPVEVRYRPLASEETEDRSPWQTASTSEIFVEVESVLPADGEATDIRGLKPLSRRQRAIPWLWIGAAVALLAAGLTTAWWIARRRKFRPEIVIPPHEVAFAALDQLRTTNFDDAEAVRRFHFSISEVIRLYVEGRFGLNATDLTTEEILAELPEQQDLRAESRQQLAEFLRQTDRVKFAHHDPVAAEIEKTYEQALSFVEATKPVEDSADESEQVEEMAA